LSGNMSLVFYPLADDEHEKIIPDAEIFVGYD
jgi:hypothetical protein